VTDRVYVEHITDPVTGEVMTFRSATEAELDRLVEERFGIDRERESFSGVDIRDGDRLDSGGK
jgi:hypothetical protein